MNDATKTYAELYAELCTLKTAADEAMTAWARARPGGRRGWKRPVNQARLDRLFAASKAASAAYVTALHACVAAKPAAL